MIKFIHIVMTIGILLSQSTSAKEHLLHGDCNIFMKKDLYKEEKFTELRQTLRNKGYTLKKMKGGNRLIIKVGTNNFRITETSFNKQTRENTKTLWWEGALSDAPKCKLEYGRVNTQLIKKKQG